MSEVVINGSNSIGTQLQQLLMADSIVPGAEPSYQLCKLIYEYHPLGAKIVETPVKIAQSRQRVITVSRGPESKMRKAFQDEWDKLRVDQIIAQVMYLKDIYGASSVAYLVEGISPDQPVDPWKLHKLDMQFNLFDPLNTAGSLVLNQNPNALDFMKNSKGIAVMGQQYHKSRSCVMFNEAPMYLSYTSSAFGFVGRSVYQRALFPLKSFIQTMTTDDMVSRKAGLLVAMVKQAGSIVNNLMAKATGLKRSLLKEAATDQVISISPDEKIETLNMQNTDVAMTTARKNIIENIATASGRPAKLLLQESFAEGFGEGSEDMRSIVQFINGIRTDMQPLYRYFDMIVQFRAWNPEFYATVQEEFPETYGQRTYQDAFLEWRNSFKATWPSLLEEPESELVKVDETKLKGIKEVFDSLVMHLDPENKAHLIDWVQDNLNEMKERMFKHGMALDVEALKDYLEQADERKAELEDRAFDQAGEQNDGSSQQGGGLKAVK